VDNQGVPVDEPVRARGAVGARDRARGPTDAADEPKNPFGTRHRVR